MNFEAYKADSLERILADPRYIEHHSEIDVILRKRAGHLHIKRGIEVLTEVAKNGETTNYKIFFESCVGGDVKWNHTKMSVIAKFLGKVLQYCALHDLPLLSALVVNIQTGECGAGFFKELLALGRATSLDDPNETAQTERERCWRWASNL